MCQWLAEPAQDHPLQFGKRLSLLQQLVKDLHLHMGFRIVPDIANARAAVEVADGGGFHIELAQVGQSGKQDQGSVTLVEPAF